MWPNWCLLHLKQPRYLFSITFNFYYYYFLLSVNSVEILSLNNTLASVSFTRQKKKKYLLFRQMVAYIGKRKFFMVHYFIMKEFTLTSWYWNVPWVITMWRLSAYSSTFPYKPKTSITSPANHTVELSACLTDNETMWRGLWSTTVESFKHEYWINKRCI